MFSKDDIKNILNKINEEYFSIKLTKKSEKEGKEINLIQQKIDEPTLSSAFVAHAKLFLNKNSSNNVICFSEYPILNDFTNIFKKTESLNDDEVTKKILLNNKKWEIDCFFSKNNAHNLIEFKYCKYTLSDLLRLMAIMLKIKEIESIILIFFKNNKLEKNFSENIEFNQFYLNESIFEETLEFMNCDDENKFKNFDFKKSLKNKIDKRLEENYDDESDWVCIKIDKNQLDKKYDDISEKNNFIKIEYLTHIEFVYKNIVLIPKKELKIEQIFIDNDFEKIETNGEIKYWNSLIRSNVIENFFIPKNRKNLSSKKIPTPKNFIYDWIIDFVENKIFKISLNREVEQNQKYLDQLKSIKVLIKEKKYKKIQEEIIECHKRISNLLATNKEIQEKKIDKNSDEDTVDKNIKNRASAIIKKIIYTFVINERKSYFFINNNDEIFDNELEKNDFEQQFKNKINIEKITKNFKNLIDLACNSLFILYFYAKINHYNEIIETNTEESFSKEKLKQFFQVFNIFERNDGESVKIINYSYYLNKIKNNKSKNIFAKVLLDIFEFKDS